MTAELQFVLLVFAVAGFAGTGACLAVARARFASEGAHDAGMFGVAGMLFIFGSLCTAVGSGVIGIVALGGVALWVGYVAVAQRLGLFRIETAWPEEAREEEPRQIT